MKRGGFVFLFFAVWVLAGTAGAAEHRTSSATTQERLERLVTSESRPEAHRERDRYRHPLETLTFFGIEPDMTVVEIWPGGQGGWYRRIIAPLMAEDGVYIPVEDEGFADSGEGLPAGTADMVLVFRAHGFMIYEKPVAKYYEAIYRMLKPGGIFGIVDHKGDEAVPQDPEGESGYVNESHVVMLAEAAGFELLTRSDVNRNPQDTKDYPDGVYSLPPTLAGTLFNRAARERFHAIGESDRFTLKFVKPQ